MLILDGQFHKMKLCYETTQRERHRREPLLRFHSLVNVFTVAYLGIYANSGWTVSQNEVMLHSVVNVFTVF